MITIIKLALVFATGTSAFVATERPTFFHKERPSNLKLGALDEIITASIFGAAVYFTITRSDQYDEGFRKEVKSWKEYDTGTQNSIEIEEIVEENSNIGEDIMETPKDVTKEIGENIEEPSKDINTVSISSTIDLSLKRSVASTLTGEKQKQARLKASEEKELVIIESTPTETKEQEVPVLKSTDSTREENSHSSFSKKAIVKALMPWRKFSSIK